ncbi:hypothetical protein L8V92_00485 [Campylobacter lari]|nr:hypothetical protein [Campylobacter lari]
MDFLKQYLGIVSTGIIFISFILGALILTWYYVFTINFIPEFNKDLIVSNIFLVSWIGFIFIPFFVIFYTIPLIYFKEFLNDVLNIKTWQNWCFILLPIIFRHWSFFNYLFFR